MKITRAIEAAEPRPSSPFPEAQAQAMAQVCLDLHDALGVRWGDNPYSRITELREAMQALREGAPNQVSDSPFDAAIHLYSRASWHHDLAEMRAGYIALRDLFAAQYAAPPAPAPSVGAEAVAFDLVAHLSRQVDFSRRTFGPGDRTAGVCDHIRKELREVQDDAAAGVPTLPEWVDVIILAFDGAWRSGATPEQIVEAIVAKQTKNEGRVWPDWRTADPTKAIEHDRSHDATPASAPPAAPSEAYADSLQSLASVMKPIDPDFAGILAKNLDSLYVEDEAPAAPQAAPGVEALEAFTEYVEANYPPGTIISDPKWHAPRLFRIAHRHIRAALAAADAQPERT